MSDFMEDSALLGWGSPPAAFIELVYLPRNGWPKSELDRLSMADRRLLSELLSLEARYTKRAPNAKPD
jgi:hypothetical protein